MTNDTSHNTSRLDALEARIAHQDETIDELNTTVTEQWATIDRLTREIENLRERVETSEAAAARPNAGEQEKPPHW